MHSKWSWLKAACFITAHIPIVPAVIIFDLAFTRRATNAKSHWLVHADIRPYTCHVCFKSFVRQSNCKRHLSLHSKEDLSTAWIKSNLPRTFPKCCLSWVLILNRWAY
jgi:hypothetical protein